MISQLELLYQYAPPSVQFYCLPGISLYELADTLREELALDWAGILPATECRTRIMALTRAGCELINLWETDNHPTHCTWILRVITELKSEESHTHPSSMLGSVNCTKRSLSWSTPECGFKEIVTICMVQQNQLKDVQETQNDLT